VSAHLFTVDEAAAANAAQELLRLRVPKALQPAVQWRQRGQKGSDSAAMIKELRMKSPWLE